MRKIPVRSTDLSEVSKMKIKSTDVRQEFYSILNVRVIDGDAIEATISLPFGACVIKRIRLKGFWAPEKEGRTPDLARLAHTRLEDWILGRDLFIRCPSERQDKFGRVIADLYDSNGPANPHDILRDAQLSEADHKADLDWARSKKDSFSGLTLFGEANYLRDIGTLDAA